MTHSDSNLEPVSDTQYDRVANVIDNELADAKNRIMRALFTPTNARAAASLLNDDLDRIDRDLHAIVTGAVSDKYRLGTELHGRLRRAKKDLDTLTFPQDTEAQRLFAADALDKLKARMKGLTERLLTEVFTAEPPADDATN